MRLRPDGWLEFAPGATVYCPARARDRRAERRTHRPATSRLGRPDRRKQDRDCRRKLFTVGDHVGVLIRLVRDGHTTHQHATVHQCPRCYLRYEVRQFEARGVA